MRYDLSSDFDVQNARARLEHLIGKQTMIDITEKKQRSLSQNSYLHVILAYFGLCTGNTLDYVKRYYYKKHCNPALFVREKTDGLTGERVLTLRSSTELTTEEMTLSIERFRNFASQEAGIYIPTSEEGQFLRQIEKDIENSKAYL